MATIVGIIADHWRRGRRSNPTGRITPASAPYYSLAIKAGVGNINVSEALGYGSDRAVLAKQHGDGSITLYRGSDVERMWVARCHVHQVIERAIQEQSCVPQEA